MYGIKKLYSNECADIWYIVPVVKGLFHRMELFVMGLGNESISFLVRIIMDDLDGFLSNKERSLRGRIYSTLGTWLEYINDASAEDKEIILNEIHETLGEMSVWEYDQNEQNEIVARMYQYFSELYGTEDHIKDFATLLVNYYKKELKAEFKYV
ncbi:hypothetical protein J2W97_002922 [Paenibacillus jamilae]|nr:hypothetical protein [Paenibacillus jamilae]